MRRLLTAILGAALVAASPALAASGPTYTIGSVAEPSAPCAGHS